MRNSTLINYFLKLLFSIVCYIAFYNADAQIFTKINPIAITPLKESGQCWQDLNNDGELDLIVNGKDPATDVRVTRVYLNMGNGNFKWIENSGIVGFHAGKIAPIDFNNDGKIDIAISGETDLGKITKIYKGNGNGTFTDVSLNNFNGIDDYTSHIQWADYDNDGDYDLIVIGDNNAYLFKNSKGVIDFDQRIDNCPATISRVVDYDKDNDYEILVTNLDYVSLYKNDGHGKFITDNVNKPNLSGPTHLITGDFDSDSDMDLILAGGSDFVNSRQSMYFKNQANHNYEYNGNLSSIFRAFEIFLNTGDLNNDGYLDLFVTGNSTADRISELFINDGTGNLILSTNNNLFSQVGCGRTELADYDNDHDLDLTFIENYGTEYSIFTNNSSTRNNVPSTPANLNVKINNRKVILSWSKATDDHTPQNGLSYNFYLYKVGGDTIVSSNSIIKTGVRKIVNWGNAELNTSWTLNDLDIGTYRWSVQAIDNNYEGGSFATESQFVISSPVADFSSTEICLGAATQFTDKSMVSSGSSISSWKWYFGDGDTAMIQNPSHTYKTAGTFLVTLFIKSNAGNDSARLNVMVKAKPKASFEVVSLPTDKLVSVKSTSDLNGLNITNYHWNFGDGYAENSHSTASHGYNIVGNYNIIHIITAENSCSDTTKMTISVNTNKDGNSGHFFSMVDFPETFNLCSAFEFADFDNDGYIDLLITGGTCSVESTTNTKIYINQKDGTFKLSPISLDGFFNGQIRLVDINNDGYIDIAFSGKKSNEYFTKIYKNKNGASFEEIPIENSRYASGSFEFADYDNDGDIDFMISGDDGQGRNIDLYENKGNRFILAKTMEGLCCGNSQWFDYDLDKDMDFIVTGLDKNGKRACWIFNNDNGSFVKIDNHYNGYEYVNVTDFDNNGSPDIVLSQYLNGEANNVFKKNIGGSFVTADSSNLLALNNGGKMLAGDMDNDGNSDLIINGENSQILCNTFIYYNHGFFSKLDREEMGGCAGHHKAVADIDNDGDLDFLFLYYGGGYQLRKNQVISKNLPPAPPANLLITKSARTVNLSWSKTSDDKTPQNGLSYNIYLYKVGGDTIISPMANIKSGKRKIISRGNADYNTGWIIKNLEIGTYRWSVQGIDNNFDGGAFAPEQEFTLEGFIPDFIFNEVCNGDSTIFKDNTLFTSGTNITSRIWNFGDGLISNEKNPKHLYLNSGNYNVTLKLFTSEGITDSITKVITVKAIPHANFLGGYICKDIPFSFENTTNTSGLDIKSWEWTIGDTTIYKRTIPNLTYSLPGFFKAKLVVVANNLCSDTIEQKINVVNYQISRITTQGDNCTLGYLDLFVPKYDEAKYQWFYEEFPINGVTQNTIKAFRTGTYKVTIDIANCPQRSIDTTLYFSGPDKPMVYIQGPNVWYAVCSNNSASTYQWYFNNFPINGANKSVFIINQMYGNYSVAISTGGCISFSDQFKVPPDNYQNTSVQNENKISISPNPSNGQFIVRLKDSYIGESKIQIVDPKGIKIFDKSYTKKSNEFIESIDIGKAIPGIYFLQLVSGSKTENYRISINPEL